MATKFAVPKASIQWLVARLHVSTPDSEVEADIRKRISCLLFACTAKQTDKCVAYALKCHKHNQALYSHVMRGF
jgi:hypothetical protein